MNLLALGILAIATLLVASALVADYIGRQRLMAAMPSLGAAVPLDPRGFVPAILAGFDPNREALLVQLPLEDAMEAEEEDFATCPSANGKGQDLLFRDRVMLHLPDISPDKRIEIYVEAITA